MTAIIVLAIISQKILFHFIWDNGQTNIDESTSAKPDGIINF